jgi:hypothetical protein
VERIVVNNGLTILSRVSGTALGVAPA